MDEKDLGENENSSLDESEEYFESKEEDTESINSSDDKTEIIYPTQN